MLTLIACLQVIILLTLLIGPDTIRRGARAFIRGAWAIARYVLAAAPPVALCFVVFMVFTSARWDSAEHAVGSIIMLALILPLPVFWSVRLVAWWWNRLGWEVRWN